MKLHKPMKRYTVPDALRHWKNNVRKRHSSRIRKPKLCKVCNRRKAIQWHHDWKTGKPGDPPKPLAVCKICHKIANAGHLPKRICLRCGLVASRGKSSRFWRKHRQVCELRNNTVSVYNLIELGTICLPNIRDMDEEQREKEKSA